MKALKNAVERVRGQLPSEYLGSLPDIRVLRMREVYIEGHRGLLSYSPERILVRTADRTLAVDGSGLSVCCVTMAEVHIRGSIRSVGAAD